MIKCNDKGNKNDDYYCGYCFFSVLVHISLVVLLLSSSLQQYDYDYAYDYGMMIIVILVILIIMNINMIIMMMMMMMTIIMVVIPTTSFITPNVTMIVNSSAIPAAAKKYQFPSAP